MPDDARRASLNVHRLHDLVKASQEKLKNNENKVKDLRFGGRSTTAQEGAWRIACNAAEPKASQVTTETCGEEAAQAAAIQEGISISCTLLIFISLRWTQSGSDPLRVGRSAPEGPRDRGWSCAQAQVKVKVKVKCLARVLIICTVKYCGVIFLVYA